MSINTRKALFIVNSRSGWAVVATLTSHGEGLERDGSGRFTGGCAFESVRVKDRRIARFSSLDGAVASVAALVERAQPDEVYLVPSSRACEEAMLERLAELGYGPEAGLFTKPLVIRRSILSEELDTKPRTPFAQAWHLARRAWFNDHVPEADRWFVVQD